jgi:uroporphyrinogen-III synthase
LLSAFADRRVVAAAVGPVTAETAEGLGIADPVTPVRARLGSMVQALAAELGERRRVVPTRAGEVTLQGRAAFVDGVRVLVGTRERAVLEVLLTAGGAVVPKSRLLRAVWGPDFDDDHAVEVAIGRLRRALGNAGGAVETIARRGYRLAS